MTGPIIKVLYVQSATKRIVTNLKVDLYFVDELDNTTCPFVDQTRVRNTQNLLQSIVYRYIHDRT